MQTALINIRIIQECDIQTIHEAYRMADRIDDVSLNYLTRCFRENQNGDRVTFIAFYGEQVAGYVNIIFKSAYPYFLENNIPEINDLSVLPQHRMNGIGKALLNSCENYAAEHYDCIGLGVGLYIGYGSAQRLYTKSGYIFDGNGLMYKNVEIKPGTNVFVDDDLLLYMTKKLRKK